MRFNSTELKYIINEAANLLLNEITVKDAYVTYYKDILENDYLTIVNTIQGNSNEQLDQDTKWVLKLYKRKSPRLMEDLYKLRNEEGDGYLDIFNRAKKRRMLSGNQANLDMYKSIADLGEFVSTLDYERIMGRSKKEMSNAVHEAKDDIEILFENDTWIILIPKTHEASCYWAQGAEWCTASRGNSYWFNNYTKDGPLYMNINKEEKTHSVQFHLETRQFMDYYDHEIEQPVFENILDGDVLRDFYYDYLEADKFMRFIGEPIGNDLYASYMYDYDYGEEGHDEEYAYFVIDSDLNRVAGPFEDVYHFNGEYAKVYNGRECNLINTDGDKIFKSPMVIVDRIDVDDESFYVAKGVDSKIRFFVNGEVIETPYTECIGVNGTRNFIVGYEKHYNVLNLDLKPIFNTDFEDIDCLNIGSGYILRIMKDYEYNIADFEGNIIWDKWVPFFVPVIGKTTKGPIFRIQTNGYMQLMDVRQNMLLPVNVLAVQHNTNSSTFNQYPFTARLLDDTMCYVDLDFNIKSFDGTVFIPNKENVNESTIKQTLTEITVQDASQKYYQDVPANDFMEIVTSLQGGNNILQPETKWALGLYKKKSPRFMEDLYKLHNNDNTGFLDVFKRAKERRMIGGQQADLNRYKSIAELGQFINSLDFDTIMGKTKGEMSNAVNAAANNADFPYEDAIWKIVIPKSYEASCYWGNGTDWCTATRENDYYYNLYSKQGPLFININKNTGEKYQFHFESEQFMDSDDIDIDKPIFNTIGASSGLIEYYKKYLGNNPYSIDFMRLQYDEYEQEETFVVFANADYEYFIIDTTWNEPVYNDWVLDYNFDDGAIRLKISIQGKTQYIVWSGYHNMIIPECMYDFIGEFEYDVAYVMQDNKYNYINNSGELLSKQWFDDCEDWDGEYDIVAINGKKNIFSRYKGEVIMEEWHTILNSLTLSVEFVRHIRKERK